LLPVEVALVGVAVVLAVCELERWVLQKECRTRLRLGQVAQVARTAHHRRSLRLRQPVAEPVEEIKTALPPEQAPAGMEGLVVVVASTHLPQEHLSREEAAMCHPFLRHKATMAASANTTSPLSLEAVVAEPVVSAPTIRPVTVVSERSAPSLQQRKPPLTASAKYLVPMSTSLAVGAGR